MLEWVGIQQADRSQAIARIAEQSICEVAADHAGADDEGRGGQSLA
jgi:hypothetical protein